MAALFTVLLLASCCYDIHNRLIPNWISLALACSFVVHLLVEPERVDAIGSSLVAAAVFGVLFLAFALGVLGGGDVKLLTAVSLWAGPGGIAELLMLTALFGGVLAVAALLVRGIRRLRRLLDGRNDPAPPDRGLPYGVAIAMAGIIVVGGDLVR